MHYDVTVSRVGSVSVTADSPEQAMEIANSYGTDKIHWADDFQATDAQPEEAAG